MKKTSLVIKILSVIIFSTLLLYVLLPDPEFPLPPPDSVQSSEPADSETPLRRAYFTNFTRDEVQNHYVENYKLPVKIPFLPIKLIYPTEEAFTLIRDQTRSTHLVEYVYPLRQSLFINEYYAKAKKDDINYKGEHYEQKIIIKVDSSSVFTRIIVVFLITVSFYLVFRELPDAIRAILK